MPTYLHRLLQTDGPRAVVVIRLLAGLVFVSEGIQKFLFAETLGVGRFVKLGIPAPHVLAPFVGVVEIIAGGLLVIGLLTRLAAVPLIFVMLVAIWTTKIPLLGKPGGFWTVAHDGRADWSMLLSCVFLLVVGGGALSVDARLDQGRAPPRHRI